MYRNSLHQNTRVRALTDEFSRVRMLCASVIAALEAASPVEQRPIPPGDEVASNPASVDYASSEDAKTGSLLINTSMKMCLHLLRQEWHSHSFFQREHVARS